MVRTPELVQLVRQTLSMDAEEDLENVPDYYFDFVNKVMRECPEDLNILVEAGEPNDPTKGGNGFGIITCIEEECFADVILTADKTQLDGGRGIGLGSIHLYKRHIQDPEHIASRNSRLAKEKKETRRILEAKASGLDEGTLRAFGARPSMAQMEQVASLSQQPKDDSEDELEDEVEEIGRPTWAVVSSGPPSDMSETEVEDSDAGREDSKPIVSNNKGKGKSLPTEPIVLSSDEDDHMPIRRLPASTKRRRGIILPASSLGSDAMPITVDSDDEVKPVFGTPNSSKRQKQTTLNRYRSGFKTHESDGDDVKVISETIGPSQGGSQQDVKPGQEARDQPVQPEPWFPGHYNYEVKPDPVRETKPEITQPDLGATWDGSLSPQTAGRRLQLEAKIILDPEVLRARPYLSSQINERRKEIRDQLERVRKAAMGTLNIQVKPPSMFLLQLFTDLAGLWPEEVNANRRRFALQHEQKERDRINRVEAVQRLQQVKMEAQRHIGSLLAPPPIMGNAIAGPSQARGIPAYPNGPTLNPQPQFDLLAVAENEAELWHRSGPQLREDQLHKFFEDSLNEFAEYETVADAATKLGLGSMDEALPSMKVKLMPHQVIGVAWMLDMERNAKRKGGILADSMGLGKTIQMIATMAENPSANSKRKTTLVIAPLALLEQWKSEMRKFVNKKWRIHIYHGKGAKISLNQMKQCDVIITTFGQVIGAFAGTKKRKSDSEFSSGEEGQEAPRYGDLLKMNWYRVCVDEAAQIRNHATKGARAIFKLHSVYRWILSGTLVVNTLVDLFSPLYFLGISELSVWKTFREKIKSLEKRRPDLAAKRLQAVLKYACLRRTATSKIDGKPILTLPEKTLIKRPGDFDPDERSVYDIIEARAIARFNKYLKANTVLKNYAHVLTMILRLRQICNSVSLVVRKPGEPGRPDDLLISEVDLARVEAEAVLPDWSREGEMNRARAVGGDELVNRLIIKFAKRQADIEAADGADDEESQEQALDEVDLECAVCYEAFGDDERVTACCHSYCVACMPGILNPTVARSEVLCPMCRKSLDPERVFVAAAFKPIDVKAEENVDELDLDIKVDMDLGENMPPSTKMQEVLNLVEGWRLSAPRDKILIFSQFVSMIDLLAAYLRQHDIDVETYTGKMSKDDRDATLDEFRRFDGPQVCIISTKAGGVGLNLVCANKVILLDHTWTYAATAQAVDRAWRIGQTKPVEVVELSIGNTIEQRILDLQEKKKQLADAAFGEGGGGKIGRLSLADLRMLFDRDA